MTFYRTKLFFTTLILFFSKSVFDDVKSQVTLGSAIRPQSGALLDIKNTDELGANSTKGVILPRVNLFDLEELSMGDNIINDGDYDGNQFSKHIGLLVYNMHNDLCATDYPIEKGVHLWNGKKWIRIGDDDEILADGVYWFTDTRDNQRYLAREFFYVDQNNQKISAGDWMLQNLAFNPLMNPSPNYDGFIETLGTGNTNDEKRYAKWFYYAIDKKYNVPTIPAEPADWHKYRFNGIVYSFEAATNGQNSFINDPEFNQTQVTPLGDTPGPYEIESLVPEGYIQGICPDGWHLPSDREWTELCKILYNNPTRYSSIEQSEVDTWPEISVWDAENYSNDVLGKVVKSFCTPKTSSITFPSDGKSFSSRMGGFNVLLVGTVENQAVEDDGESYFWSSSRHGWEAAWRRKVFYGDDDFNRNGGLAVWNMFSVRCKKN